MGKKTRAITLSSLFSALAVIFLYIASVWPTGQLGLVAVSSLFVAASVIEAGLVYGLYTFIVSSALGMLLIPDKTAAFLFILFFGFYPLIKCVIERINGLFPQWLLKFLVFNASLTVVWFLLRGLLFDSTDNMPGTAVAFIGGNAVFALFDYGYTKVIRLYYTRVPRRRQ